MFEFPQVYLPKLSKMDELMLMENVPPQEDSGDARSLLAGSLVHKGDFIEETLGIAEREDILKNGSSLYKAEADQLVKICLYI